MDEGSMTIQLVKIVKERGNNEYEEKIQILC